MYAFCCRNCGHLEDCAHAGENAVPAACRACSAGVVFSPKGIRTFQPENWETLADAAPERLTELGLTPADVSKHTPVPAGTPATTGTYHERTASDGASVTDAGAGVKK